jgi:hypothetical protein
MEENIRRKIQDTEELNNSLRKKTQQDEENMREQVRRIHNL